MTQFYKIKKSIPVILFFFLLLLPLKLIAEQNSNKTQHTDQIDNSERAKQHYDRGLTLYDEDNFEGALIEFRRAYELRPSPVILFNISQVLWTLHRYVECISALEEYIRLYPDSDSQTLQQVQNQLNNLIQRVGHVQFKITPADSLIKIDDNIIGKSPIEKELDIDVGEHNVEIQNEGYKTYSERISIAAQETKILEVTLQPILEKITNNNENLNQQNTINLTKTNEPSNISPSPFYKKWWFWTTVGVVVVGIGIGTTFGIMSSQEGVDADWRIERYKKTIIDQKIKKRI